MTTDSEGTEPTSVAAMRKNSGSGLRTPVSTDEMAHVIGEVTPRSRRSSMYSVPVRHTALPFFVRLRAAVTADDLDLTDDELGLLRKMRDRRNDVLHGRERRDPEPDELSCAIELVGRLLASRIQRLPRT